MHPKAHCLTEHPVIAAVKDAAGLERALASECGAVFLLFGSLAQMGGLVRCVQAAGKTAVVHIDLIDGLAPRDMAVDALACLAAPDGIISTRAGLIRRAQHLGLLTVQRAFMLDSMSVTNLPPLVEAGHPDYLEILPGIMPRVIARVCQTTSVPVIAGGLIEYKQDVMAALAAGAAAVSTTCPAVWAM